MGHVVISSTSMFSPNFPCILQQIAEILHFLALNGKHPILGLLCPEPEMIAFPSLAHGGRTREHTPSAQFLG
jgi:hypothetical protein